MPRLDSERGTQSVVCEFPRRSRARGFPGALESRAVRAALQSSLLIAISPDPVTPSAQRMLELLSRVRALAVGGSGRNRLVDPVVHVNRRNRSCSVKSPSVIPVNLSPQMGTDQNAAIHLYTHERACPEARSARGRGVSNNARARQRPWISAVSARADSRAA